MILFFKGFDDWVEIFAGGRQTDSQGKQHDGDLLIDQAVSTFDPDFHEPPAVVGHPKDDSPAYGLVQAVKASERDGRKILLARFKDVHEPFAEMVQAGRFPKRSAAFYPDGRLRHVGFLGAMPPAVKGLKNISFKNDDADAIAFEFDQPLKEESSMKFAEFFEVFKIWKKFEKDPDAVIDLGGDKGGTRFSEADIEAARKKAAEEAESKVRAEFAETQRTEAKRQRDKQVAEWVESQVAAGIIPPAIRDDGLVTFMQGLSDEEVTFAEGQEKKSGLEWFKGFLGTLGKSPLFSEIATKDAAGQRQSIAEAEYALGKDIGERANR